MKIHFLKNFNAHAKNQIGIKFDFSIDSILL